MTHAGSTFKRHVDGLLHQLDDGLAAVHQIVEPETGTVGLAFQNSLATWLVPFLVSSFRQAHPGVKFDLAQVRDEWVDSVLETGNSDLVLSTVRPQDPSVQGQRLMDEPLRLAVASSHRLAAESQVRLADAAAEPFLMLRRSSLLRRTSNQLCQEAGFTPVVSFEGDDIHTLRGFVAAALGVAIIPAPGGAVSDAGAGAVRYLEITDVPATREISIAWSAERRLLPASQVFRDHVLDLARTHQLPAAGDH